MKPKRTVTLVEKQKDLEILCKLLSKENFVALDVETSININPPELYLIQFSNKEQNWIIDPLSLRITDLTPVKNILENKNIIKIIHNSPFEKKVFSTYGYEIYNIYDTLTASRKIRGMKAQGGHSLKQVCLRELNIEIDKNEQTSNWQKRPLRENQIDYAALDSEVLIDIYKIFNKNLFEEAVLTDLKNKKDIGNIFESELKKLLTDIGESIDGNSEELFKRLQNKLNLSPENHRALSLIQILEGLKDTALGISCLVNNQKNKNIPKHHQELIKASTDAVINFLKGTIEYQRQKGVLK